MDAPAGGMAAGLGSTHATPPGGGPLGGADDEASPDELQPMFVHHGAGEPALPAGQERPGELALWAERGSAGIAPSTNAPSWY